MAKIVFPNAIVLEEVDGGLLVRQGDEVYVARNWVLTEPVIALVEAAMSAGLCWMIRTEHPRRNARWPNKRGVVYLAFSPSQHQQWALAVDTIRPATGDYGHAVFNGKYHEQFLKLGLRFTFEKRNKGSGQEPVICEFRRQTKFSLDNVFISLKARIPALTRSNLHRCLQRHGLNRLPIVCPLMLQKS